jgi:two-component system chemotaxis response regulator CheY
MQEKKTWPSVQMSITALVVDDSAASRQIISYYLRAAGCAVVAEAGNALKGLELFRQLRPNIVTLDLMMPGLFNIDSMGLLRTMKREMPKVAVIVVSAIPFEKTRKDFLEEGVLAYVVKPLTHLSFEPVRTKLAEAFPELADAHPKQ